MKLVDLRRYAIRSRTRVHFSTPAGECLVNEQGIVKLPGVRGIPQINAEESLASADKFVLDPAEGSSKQRNLSRNQLEALVSEGAGVERPQEE